MSTNAVTLLVGAVTAFVALIGYWVTQASGRRDAASHTYAQALEAVKDFEEMPYRIARRPDSDPATRQEVGALSSNSYVRVEFFRAWLRISSPLAGEAYSILLQRTHAQVRPHIRRAWASGILERDADAHLNAAFDCDNAFEWDLCVRVFRRELSVLAGLFRWRSRGEIERYRALSAEFQASGVSVPGGWQQDGVS